MHTCRFCKKDDPKLGQFVKYGARHWAHYGCWLGAKEQVLRRRAAQRLMRISVGEVVETLTELHAWQLRNFPVFRLADFVKTNGITCTGKTAVDKAMYLLKLAIEVHEEKDKAVAP